MWFGVRRGLAPLQSLQVEIAARSHRDLRPVPEHHAPDEVRPVVASLNALLARLNDSMNGQQRFLANAAHQLRTPCPGCKPGSSLPCAVPCPLRLRATLTHLLDATVRTAHLANQLLTLARAEPGAMPPDAMQPLDLRNVVEDAAREWVPRAMERQIDLGFDMENAWLVGEPLLIRELLANLIDNALRYTPAGGSVTVRCLQAGAACAGSRRQRHRHPASRNRTRCANVFIGSKAARVTAAGWGWRLCRKLRACTTPRWKSRTG